MNADTISVSHHEQLGNKEKRDKFAYTWKNMAALQPGKAVLLNLLIFVFVCAVAFMVNNGDIEADIFFWLSILLGFFFSLVTMPSLVAALFVGADEMLRRIKEADTHAFHRYTDIYQDDVKYRRLNKIVTISLISVVVVFTLLRYYERGFWLVTIFFISTALFTMINMTLGSMIIHTRLGNKVPAFFVSDTAMRDLTDKERT